MVEYNGQFHYQRAFCERTINDVLKRRYCRQNNIVQINVNPVIPRGINSLQSYLTFTLYTEVPSYAEQLEKSPLLDVSILKGRTFALLRNDKGLIVDAATVNTIS